LEPAEILLVMVATLLEIQMAANQRLQLRAIRKIILILIEIAILTATTTTTSVFNATTRTIIIQRTTNAHRILSQEIIISQ